MNIRDRDRDRARIAAERLRRLLDKPVYWRAGGIVHYGLCTAVDTGTMRAQVTITAARAGDVLLNTVHQSTSVPADLLHEWSI